MSDYKKEWMAKAKIDYFAPFINLWLACNSWYKHHYSDIDAKDDRTFIDKIKSDTTNRNHLYRNFKRLIEQNAMDGANFRHHIENLSKSLYKAEIKPDKLKFCSLDYVLIDYNEKDNINAYQSVFVKVEFKADGITPKVEYVECIKLDKQYLSADLSKVFAGVFEIIYTVRNTLVHGKMQPSNDQHDVVKYCYLILWNLMSD